MKTFFFKLYDPMALQKQPSPNLHCLGRLSFVEGWMPDLMQIKYMKCQMNISASEIVDLCSFYLSLVVNQFGFLKSHNITWEFLSP